MVVLQRGFDLPTGARHAGSVVVLGSNGQVGSHDVHPDGVPVPTLTVGRSGSVGKVCFSEAGAWPLNTTLFAKDYCGNDPRYIYFWLQHFDLTRYAQGVSVPTLNRNSFSEIRVLLPPINEQQGIAKSLDQCWGAVATERAIQAASAELKSAISARLFTRGLRGEAQKETELGFVPDSWKVVRLGDLGRVGNGSTPRRTNSDYWKDGTYPWLNSAKVYDREIISADQFVTATALAECHLPKIQPGALLMAITGQGKTLGHCAVLRVAATVSQHVAYVQTDLTLANPSFVRGYLETQYDYLRQVGAGGGSTKGALTCAFLRSLPIPLPTLAEQDEIVEVLDAIDRKIELHQQKCAVLESLFKALLHQLMTGEIDVNDLNLQALSIDRPAAERSPA